MTWFNHVCHWCGHRHKDLHFIVNRESPIYQCKDREACEARRERLTFEQRIQLDIFGECP